MKKLISLLIISFSFQALATQDIGKVKRIFVFKTSYGFMLEEGFGNAASDFNCSGKNGFARIPKEGNPNSTEMYSAILSAMAAGKTIRVNTEGCNGSHFTVSGIYVESY